MTTLTSKTKNTAMVALLIIAGAFLAPNTASAEQMKVKFTYKPAASAQEIYSGFQRTAHRACHTFGARPLEFQKHEQACIQDMLEKVVDRLGRGDVEQVHRGSPAMLASR